MREAPTCRPRCLTMQRCVPGGASRMPAFHVRRSLPRKQTASCQQACTLTILSLYPFFFSFSSLVFCSQFNTPAMVAWFSVPEIHPTSRLGTTRLPVPLTLNPLPQIVHDGYPSSFMYQLHRCLLGEPSRSFYIKFTKPPESLHHIPPTFGHSMFCSLNLLGLFLLLMYRLSPLLN